MKSEPLFTVAVAWSVWHCLRGFAGRPEPDASHGLLIPGDAVHTFFLRYPIDILFLDHDLRVLKVCSNVRPWHGYIGCPHASVVLEVRHGTAASLGIVRGSQVRVEVEGFDTVPGAESVR
ncbi:MAG TPA: DUF192 domain-containing protein [Rhodanobacteraceae bacterium]